jgi:hypothetical protein
MELVWSDEFDGDAIDPSNWNYDIGGWGWGNGEAQYYTDRPENARVQNGLLVIEGRFERFEESYYTSARLITQDLREFQYGRIEARIKPPTGVGTWPAFWMLGADFERDPADPIQSNWPDIGEIDIMEYVGQKPDLVLGTLHGPGYAGAGGLTRWNRRDYIVGDDFHTFAIDWDEEGIRWLYDGEEYYDLGPESLGGREWVFDQPFFIILNLALGGTLGGTIGLDTEFPQHHVRRLREGLSAQLIELTCRVPPPAVVASRRVPSVERSGDLGRPGIDRIPVPEIARRYAFGVGREVFHETFGNADRFRRRVPGSEEHLRSARVQRRLQFVELLGSGGLEDVASLVVDEVGAQRSAAEQPHRFVGQFHPVPPGERGGVLQPVVHVGGAAEHDGVVVVDAADLGHGQTVSRRAGRSKCLRRPAPRFRRWNRAGWRGLRERSWGVLLRVSLHHRGGGSRFPEANAPGRLRSRRGGLLWSVGPRSAMLRGGRLGEEGEPHDRHDPPGGRGEPESPRRRYVARDDGRARSLSCRGVRADLPDRWLRTHGP